MKEVPATEIVVSSETDADENYESVKKQLADKNKVITNLKAKHAEKESELQEDLRLVRDDPSAMQKEIDKLQMLNQMQQKCKS